MPPSGARRRRGRLGRLVLRSSPPPTLASRETHRTEPLLRRSQSPSTPSPRRDTTHGAGRGWTPGAARRESRTEKSCDAERVRGSGDSGPDGSTVTARPSEPEEEARGSAGINKCDGGAAFGSFFLLRADSSSASDSPTLIFTPPPPPSSPSSSPSLALFPHRSTCRVCHEPSGAAWFRPGSVDPGLSEISNVSCFSADTNCGDRFGLGSVLWQSPTFTCSGFGPWSRCGSAADPSHFSSVQQLKRQRHKLITVKCDCTFKISLKTRQVKRVSRLWTRCGSITQLLPLSGHLLKAVQYKSRTQHVTYNKSHLYKRTFYICSAASDASLVNFRPGEEKGSTLGKSLCTDEQG